MSVTTQLTAAEYKASLIPEGREQIRWNIETAAIYVNLLYPHITLVEGQEWSRVDRKLEFLCEKHGLYSTQLKSVIAPLVGCQCRGCQSDLKKASAGIARIRRSSQQEKDLAVKLHSEGMSYSAIGRELCRDRVTITRWLYPEVAEKRNIRTAEWRVDNLERVKSTKSRYFKEFEHGKAAVRAGNAIRRQRKRNTPELVFIDNNWFEVDREETWRVFNEALLPHIERKEIQELYLEADYLIQQTGVEHHIDHIQPLSVGGEHRMVNLQILPEFENKSKSNTFRPQDKTLLCSRYFDTDYETC